MQAKTVSLAEYMYLYNQSFLLLLLLHSYVIFQMFLCLSAERVSQVQELSTRYVLQFLLTLSPPLRSPGV